MKSHLTSLLDLMFGFCGAALVMLTMVTFDEGKPFVTPPVTEWQVTRLTFVSSDPQKLMISDFVKVPQTAAYSVTRLPPKSDGKVRLAIAWRKLEETKQAVNLFFTPEKMDFISHEVEEPKSVSLTDGESQEVGSLIYKLLKP